MHWKITVAKWLSGSLGNNELTVAKWCNMVSLILVVIGSNNGLVPDGTKPLPEPMLTYCQQDPQGYISIKFCSKFKYLHWRNAFENVICKMVAISFSGLNVLIQLPCWNAIWGWILQEADHSATTIILLTHTMYIQQVHHCEKKDYWCKKTL